MQLFIIDLKETTFDYEFRFLFPLINFIENKSDDSRNNTKLIRLKTNCITRSHRPCFTWSCLTICKNCGIISCKATKNQVFNTSLENFLLFAFLTEGCIKCKKLFCTNGNSILTFLGFYNFSLMCLFPNEWPDSKSHSNRACRLAVGICEKSIWVQLRFFILIIIFLLHTGASWLYSSFIWVSHDAWVSHSTTICCGKPTTNICINTIRNWLLLNLLTVSHLTKLKYLYKKSWLKRQNASIDDMIKRISNHKNIYKR